MECRLSGIAASASAASRTAMTACDGEGIVEQRTEPDRRDRITRRQFSRRALGVAVSAVAGAGLASTLRPRSAPAQTPRGSGEVVVCTWGGSYTESQKKAFF